MPAVAQTRVGITWLLNTESRKDDSHCGGRWCEPLPTLGDCVPRSRNEGPE